MPMTSADLVRAALAGETTPRPPYSFWTHYPDVDLDPDALVRATVALVQGARCDFVKSMPNGLYSVEDWGVQADYSDIAAGGAARVVATPIKTAEDWGRVKRLDPETGALGRELRHLAGLVAAFGPDVPVLATVFSPVTTAKKLSDGAIEAHYAARPDLVRAALAEIAATTAAFAQRAIEIGCAGVFFALQDATSAMGEQAYRSLALPHDLAALEGARAGWFNAVHMHGDDILFDLAASCPVHVLNWHLGETAPSLAEYRAAGGRKPVLGGLQRWSLTRGEMDKVAADLATIRAVDGGRGVLVSPGCVIRQPVDMDILKRAAAMIRGEC
jgi:uroporphyrinogen decarboxylase